MNQIMKRLLIGGLAFSLFVFPLVELTADEHRLDGEVVGPIHTSPRSESRLVGGLHESRLVGGSGGRTPAQSKRKSSFVSDLFRNNCARCHGADGRADTPLGRTYSTPDLTDPEWWRKNSKIASTASLAAIVSQGKGGMPAFGKKLKRTEIRLLVGYVRKFKKPGSTNR
ncbi:MAG TPA: cytochrome c [Pyrinomonadaceae bacterium]|nr:cytochrome c [Pyrinomonadaceae bacterium]